MTKQEFVNENNAMSEKANHSFSNEELIYLEKSLIELSAMVFGEPLDFVLDKHGKIVDYK